MPMICCMGEYQQDDTEYRKLRTKTKTATMTILACKSTSMRYDRHDDEDYDD